MDIHARFPHTHTHTHGHTLCSHRTDPSWHMPAQYCLPFGWFGSRARARACDGFNLIFIMVVTREREDEKRLFLLEISVDAKAEPPHFHSLSLPRPPAKNSVAKFISGVKMFPANANQIELRCFFSVLSLKIYWITQKEKKKNDYATAEKIYRSSKMGERFGIGCQCTICERERPGIPTCNRHIKSEPS